MVIICHLRLATRCSLKHCLKAMFNLENKKNKMLSRFCENSARKPSLLHVRPAMSQNSAVFSIYMRFLWR